MAPPPPAELRQGPRVAAQRGAAADERAALMPEAELERIAKLREAGRNDEADKALAEFHRRFPQHRIPDAMWERVKPR